MQMNVFAKGKEKSSSNNFKDLIKQKKPGQAACHIKEKLTNSNRINWGDHSHIEDVKPFRKLIQKWEKPYCNIEAVCNFNRTKCLLRTTFQGSSYFVTSNFSYHRSTYSSDLFFFKNYNVSFPKLTETVNQMHQVQNPLDKFRTLMMALSTKDSP
ncbi:hypothetical protein CDAR_318511 [Caerostris darwini]|uniref:Uncharacterized protein n=1 Tax=Caerostris darwini TaxID=1538125 RepID=A0AAV4Q568_9ARAC|nr:hypothetical protein CDAR_318511 [Caerostris darwini]